MTVKVYTSKLICNNETLEIGSYNWFSILIRDKDGCVNVTKLVQLINKKDNKSKQLKTFFKMNDYDELNDELLKKLQEVLIGNFLSILWYELNQGYTVHFMDTYVYPKLVNAVVMWTSPRYQLIMSEIIDNINLQVHLLQIDGSEYLK
jgi:hypothetical protein